MRDRKLFGSKRPPPTAQELLFNERVAQLRASTTAAVKWNKTSINRQVNLRVGWAQWNHTRMCVLADTLVQLTQFRSRQRRGEECTLDHYSMAATTRSIIDTGAFIAYLAEQPASRTEWEVKRLLVYLHDAATRSRMWKC